MRVFLFTLHVFVCVCSRDGSCKMNLKCKVQGVLSIFTCNSALSIMNFP